MHARIGGNDDSIVEIGRAQSLVFGTVEREIDQPIVDEIDRLPSASSRPRSYRSCLPSTITASIPCFWKKRCARTNSG